MHKMKQIETLEKLAVSLDNYLSGRTDLSSLQLVIVWMKDNDKESYRKIAETMCETYNHICGRLIHLQKLAQDADKRQQEINFDEL